MGRKNGKAWYREQLKTTEWKARRKVIYDRDGYSCVDCGDTRSTIACHHEHYVKGKNPWDYPDWALVTVCDSCHKKRHQAVILTHGSHEEADMWLLFAQIENDMIEHELELRNNRIYRLEMRGAEWDPEGRYYSLTDSKGRERNYDEDGNEM